ncbi:MAG: adenosylmethionine-8-amino-7-oxononanoate aminotransferase, partial [Polyangiales bacterium]
LRRACDEADVLLIADEIFVGFGRLGELFACDSADVVPDIMTLSKALTGGTLPLAATVVSRDVFAAFWSDRSEDALMHGPTYMGNALACAAANASLDLFESEGRVEQARVMESTLEEGLAALRDVAGVRDVRCLGAIGVVQLEEPGDLESLKARFIRDGVWVRPFRDIVYVTPALNMNESDLHILLSAVDRGVREHLSRS